MVSIRKKYCNFFQINGFLKIVFVLTPDETVKIEN